jgi:GDP-L-fucose synthase
MDQASFHPDSSRNPCSDAARPQAAAAEVVIWGSGTPMREFLHVDDMAAASVHVMNLPLDIYQEHTRPMLSHINVGTGVDCTIRELAETLARVTGFKGQLVFDASKPDGAPRKLMDVSRLKSLGWQAQIKLEDGLRETYAWFQANQDRYRQA